jgi:pyruvate formate lyase activating enzyme
MIDGRLQLNRSECDLCFDCIDECYPGALRKVGLEYTPASLVKALMKDEVFFRQSNGGVTFSGGEPMLQLKFVRETAKMLKAKGIHVAMETNMKVSWKKYLEILPLLDLVMADIKHVDESAHRHWTGAGNETILRNIRNLDQAGVPYILRTPVVPGVNDALVQMEEILSFVSGLKNYEKYELLPYHPLADFKYENLGCKNPFDGVTGMKNAALEKFEPLFEQYKINDHGRAQEIQVSGKD